MRTQREIGMTARTPLALALALALSAAAGAAQTTVIDEGSFRISVRGSTVGTETFTIRRSGAGANATTVAQGRVVLDTGEQIRTVIQLSGDPISLTAYQIEVTGDDRQSITGRAAGSRVRATMVSDASEQMREFLIDPGAIVLDDASAHQLYFVARRGGGSIPVVLPRQSREVTARVRDLGTESIEIAGQRVTARHFTVDIDGMDDRSVWVDAQNRVLQAEIPDQDLIAQRTALP
jgi:hypothetical protein